MEYYLESERPGFICKSVSFMLLIGCSVLVAPAIVLSILVIKKP